MAAPRKRKNGGSERICSNCGKDAKIASALTVTHYGRLVVILCEQCQQATKIQVTLVKKQGQWDFAQYFPLES